MDAQTRLFRCADILGNFIHTNPEPDAVGEHTKMVLEALGTNTDADEPLNYASDDNPDIPYKRARHGWY